MRRGRAAGERTEAVARRGGAGGRVALGALRPRAVRCACALLVLGVPLAGPWGLSPRSGKGSEHGAGAACAERPNPSAARSRGWGWRAGMRALGSSRLLCPRKLVTSEPKFLPVGMGVLLSHSLTTKATARANARGYLKSCQGKDSVPHSVLKTTTTTTTKTSVLVPCRSVTEAWWSRTLLTLFRNVLSSWLQDKTIE